MNIVAPQRATRTYTQLLAGTLPEVFPLLCPVREAEWVNGWDPDMVITASGVAELECVFTTGPENEKAIWTVTRFEPPQRVEFVKVTPGHTVARIAIELAGSGPETAAQVTYSYTALSPRGSEFVEAFTKDYYAGFMKEWEEELNHFLRTGAKRPAGD